MKIFLWELSTIAKKKVFFCFFCLTKQGGHHASRWIRDFGSKGLSLIFAYFYMFLSFCVLDDFFCFSNNSGFRYSGSTRKPRFRWIRDLWSKGVSLILAYFQTLLIFLFWMIFFVFQKICFFGYFWSTLLWYRCYYLHRSKDALSPVCRIFLLTNDIGPLFEFFSRYLREGFN